MKKIIGLLILAALIVWIYISRDHLASVDTPMVAAPIALSEEEIHLPLIQEYIDERFMFSFKYPDGFEVTQFEDGNNKVVVVQNLRGQGFQVYMRNTPNQIPELTAKIIKRDLPKLDIREEKSIAIAGVGKGISFLSTDPQFAGESREIWFTHKKVLFQISSYASSSNLIDRIIATWQFR